VKVKRMENTTEYNRQYKNEKWVQLSVVEQLEGSL
jgi:hypothetical protein